MNANGAAPKDNFVVGLGVGVAVGVVLLCLGSAAMFAYSQKRAADARKGWNLVPVVVAAVDVTEGTTLTMEQLSQRSIPEQFVTSSVVKPDSASYIVNQKVLVPLQAGDPLRWSDFETKKATPVLFAAREVPLGAVLSAADVEVRAGVEQLLTDSWVRAEEQGGLIGRITIAPFHKGDPLLWTHVPPKALK